MPRGTNRDRTYQKADRWLSCRMHATTATQPAQENRQPNRRAPGTITPTPYRSSASRSAASEVGGVSGWQVSLARGVSCMAVTSIQFPLLTYRRVGAPAGRFAPSGIAGSAGDEGRSRQPGLRQGLSNTTEHRVPHAKWGRVRPAEDGGPSERHTVPSGQAIVSRTGSEASDRPTTQTIDRRSRDSPRACIAEEASSAWLEDGVREA